MLALARAAGFEPVEVGDEATRLAVRRPLPAPPPAVGTEPFVVVHPGASVPARAPRPQDAAAIVAELVRRGRRVVVTGGPSETSLTAAVARGSALDLVVDLGGRTDLATLAAVLDAADAVVVGNTGPAHLAAAVGTPVVSLFAPVVPLERWHPWGVPVRVLGEQESPCRGTGARECPVPGHPCLATVPVQQVADAVAELVADHHPHGRRAVSA
jgi:ADP-heptose:LPS heptosyltransferase